MLITIFKTTFYDIISIILVLHLYDVFIIVYININNQSSRNINFINTLSITFWDPVFSLPE